MLETTIKHPFTDDDDHPDTDAFYQTLLFEIDELIDTTNFRESSISLTFNDEKNQTCAVSLITAAPSVIESQQHRLLPCLL
jgi:hypothetical protein